MKRSYKRSRAGVLSADHRASARLMPLESHDPQQHRPHWRVRAAIGALILGVPLISALLGSPPLPGPGLCSPDPIEWPHDETPGRPQLHSAATATTSPTTFEIGSCPPP